MADIGQAQGWNAEQVSFALNADPKLWAAFSGDDFTESQTQCQIIDKTLPIDIWNDAEALQWKQKQQALRKKIEHCHNVKFISKFWSCKVLINSFISWISRIHIIKAHIDMI